MKTIKEITAGNCKRAIVIIEKPNGELTFEVFGSFLDGLALISWTKLAINEQLIVKLHGAPAAVETKRES